LLSERKQWERGREVWKKIRKDNHWLDCLGIHLALTHIQWSPSLAVMAQSMRGSGLEASAPPPAPGMSTGPGPGGPGVGTAGGAGGFNRQGPAWRW